MNVGAATRQARWEQIMFWRNPVAATFTFAFPLMFLVIFTAINGNGHIDVPGGVVKFAQYYVPAIVSFGIISACYTNLAFTICIRRENGILKRTRGTPLAPIDYLGGIVLNVVVVALILTALTIALGVIAYGVTFPHRVVGLLVTIAVGAFCFSAVGVLVSTLVPNEDAAPAVINFLLFPLAFISGTFGTISNDSALGRIAAVFPIRHLVQQMVAVFNPLATGSGVSGYHTGMMLLWGVLALAVAIRRFRWEPRTA